MQKSIPISVTILTKNCQATLRSTLLSVESFDEVLLLDTGSTDQTLEIAKTFPNVRIQSSPFLGFGPLHNLATSLAKHEWVLSLDSDEVLSQELIEEIGRLDLKKTCVYSIQRHNFFNGRRITGCSGWHPDIVVRLYCRTQTRFDDAEVHEKVLTQNLTVTLLKNPVLHTPYREMSDFLTKMQTYSTLFAKQYQGKKSTSITKALFHSWFAFFKSYIFKRGICNGREGFLISIYNAHTTFYKYTKLLESNERSN